MTSLASITRRYTFHPIRQEQISPILPFSLWNRCSLLPLDQFFFFQLFISFFSPIEKRKRMKKTFNIDMSVMRYDAKKHKEETNNRSLKKGMGDNAMNLSLNIVFKSRSGHLDRAVSSLIHRVRQVCKYSRNKIHV